MARFRRINPKVSINLGVSPKKRDEACHTPYIKKRVVKSALEILRFPILSAFSHKELLVPFLTLGRYFCQNSDMSTNVHTCTRTGNATAVGRRAPFLRARIPSTRIDHIRPSHQHSHKLQLIDPFDC